MAPAATTYRLVEGTGIVLRHRGEVLRLLPGAPVTLCDAEELPQAA